MLLILLASPAFEQAAGVNVQAHTHIERPRAALVATLLFALAVAPTAAIVLIQGNPFQHPTDVTSAPIKAAVSGL
ncbi:MAG: hypothetical protein HHJ17_05985 [Rhodoferax sp.]|uniref:hypothetical protein n=1 Tax=Rhodoferax sp. TaxID=50421 RepID=UPI00183CE988|nr:hypothetical protein [Rhodoferax sp.]NMM13076.1 hypothetical protein [Rhodoferax sp.]